MSDTSPLSSAFVELATTTRSGRDESLHYGAVVTLGMDGSIEHELGDSSVVVYPRSSNKPIQATAMVSAGLALPPRLLALVCASHDGRPEHLAAVREILSTAKLTESALGNTPDFPLNIDASEAVLRRGGIRTALQMNCSGKHAGMLATCVHNDWSHDMSYLQFDHPLQQRITQMVFELSGEQATHIGVDGCGAPAHAMSLVGLARAFRAIVMSPEDSPAGAVAFAMRSHPEMVGGPTRDVTLLMQGISGLMAKDGADGVFAAALPDGRAVALKISDGANRARPPVMRAALQALGVDISGVDPRAFSSPIFGHGKPVGEVRVIARF
ncbi:MAG: asparaginase [Ilumatobacteraceae bacterium]